MLFNSYAFIFLFLPITFAGFFLVARYDRRLAAAWLGLASLFFYGWWNPAYLVLLLLSILFNYGAGYLIGLTRHAARKAAAVLTFAIATNLMVLGYFKYANFFMQTVAPGHWRALDIILPLGISFFTFTQIAFLVDVKRGAAREYSFVHYLLFVTFFPHLIAGPVLHHKQMMPQFNQPSTYRFDAANVEIGLTIFIIGLLKKVVLADQFATYANPIFDTAKFGSPHFIEAWGGALAYTLQLYFDFSGYSDMAIGLARMFNIKLPLNFNSPYKAVNIIEFWRRWHMTLSAFLRDYLYFPLGGNRKGPARRYTNLFITMLLGGLWHGAGWTFVAWGALHGIFLCLNHAWHGVLRAAGVTASAGPMARGLSIAFTFLLVVVAWVPFRADDLTAAKHVLAGMFGVNGVSLAKVMESRLGPVVGQSISFDGFFPLSGASAASLMTCTLVGMFIVWAMPNTQEWMVRSSPAWDHVTSNSRLVWQPSRATAVAFGALFSIALVAMTRASPFLYFQF